MYKGIVLNEVQRNAFLSIAANEGLICEKSVSDGIYRNVTQFNPSHQLAEEIFNQFVVAGVIYIDPFIYKYLDGELIEREIIMPYQNTNTKLEFSYFDAVSIRKMLNEKCYDINYYTEKRIMEIWHELEEKIIECLAMEEKYGFDYNELNIRSFFVEQGHIKPYDNFRESKYYLELYSEITKNVIYQTIAEYRRILNISFSNDLLCPVINSTTVKTHDSLIGSDNAVKILKYTSDKLGKIYVANTIKDNISIVQSSEAVVYRNKINEWIMSLSRQDFGNLEFIENDIIEAQRAMKHKNWIELVGKISATIGVGASLLTHNPSCLIPCSVIAEIATYAGAPTAFCDPLKKEKYLWASFGMNKQ